MRRLMAVLLASIAGVTLLGVASYQHARGVAAELTGALSPGVAQFRDGLVPFRRHPNGQWGWVISYGPGPGDAHAEIYVRPFGQVVGTNPPDLRDRVPVGRASRPAT